MLDAKYSGEVLIKYSNARATVTPAPCDDYEHISDLKISLAR